MRNKKKVYSTPAPIRSGYQSTSKEEASTEVASMTPNAPHLASLSATFSSVSTSTGIPHHGGHTVQPRRTSQAPRSPPKPIQGGASLRRTVSHEDIAPNKLASDRLGHNASTENHAVTEGKAPPGSSRSVSDSVSSNGSRIAPQQRPRKPVLCVYHYKHGRCLKGDHCDFAHEKIDRVCKNWERGMCSQNLCAFRHGYTMQRNYTFDGNNNGIGNDGKSLTGNQHSSQYRRDGGVQSVFVGRPGFIKPPSSVPQQNSYRRKHENNDPKQSSTLHPLHQIGYDTQDSGGRREGVFAGRPAFIRPHSSVPRQNSYRRSHDNDDSKQASTQHPSHQIGYDTQDSGGPRRDKPIVHPLSWEQRNGNDRSDSNTQPCIQHPAEQGRYSTEDSKIPAGKPVHNGHAAILGSTPPSLSKQNPEQKSEVSKYGFTKQPISQDGQQPTNPTRSPLPRDQQGSILGKPMTASPPVSNLSHSSLPKSSSEQPSGGAKSENMQPRPQARRAHDGSSEVENNRGKPTQRNRTKNHRKKKHLRNRNRAKRLGNGRNWRGGQFNKWKRSRSSVHSQDGNQSSGNDLQKVHAADIFDDGNGDDNGDECVQEVHSQASEATTTGLHDNTADSWESDSVNDMEQLKSLLRLPKNDHHEHAENFKQPVQGSSVHHVKPAVNTTGIDLDPPSSQSAKCSTAAASMTEGYSEVPASSTGLGQPFQGRLRSLRRPDCEKGAQVGDNKRRSPDVVIDLTSPIEESSPESGASYSYSSTETKKQKTSQPSETSIPYSNPSDVYKRWMFFDKEPPCTTCKMFSCSCPTQEQSRVPEFTSSVNPQEEQDRLFRQAEEEMKPQIEREKHFQKARNRLFSKVASKYEPPDDCLLSDDQMQRSSPKEAVLFILKHRAKDTSSISVAYSVLGLPMRTSMPTVRRRYRVFAKLVHPDKRNSGEDAVSQIDAETAFKILNEAYGSISRASTM
eukprot:gb/GECG01001882.1/.p1 GENE.gb/GECG01001882.1/~~gb/GECG01001882.1/.p1  ORF type:complete len:960 (+),score=98.94 gb/GECG01001882.1/:1-2880(+)